MTFLVIKMKSNLSLVTCFEKMLIASHHLLQLLRSHIMLITFY